MICVLKQLFSETFCDNLLSMYWGGGVEWSRIPKNTFIQYQGLGVSEELLNWGTADSITLLHFLRFSVRRRYKCLKASFYLFLT